MGAIVTFKEKLEWEKEKQKNKQTQPRSPMISSNTVKTALGWGIVLYTGKVLYDWWKDRKNTKSVKKIESILGKKSKFHLDLYSNDRDAKIVESCITRFNEVLSSRKPQTIVTDKEEYETYYTAASEAVQRSSPSKTRDQSYLDACIEYIRNI